MHRVLVSQCLARRLIFRGIPSGDGSNWGVLCGGSRCEGLALVVRHSRLFGDRFKTLVESEAGQEQFKIVARRAFSERF